MARAAGSVDRSVIRLVSATTADQVPAVATTGIAVQNSETSLR
jgi:hypothetical protein